jgi:hypothetical protein
MPKWICKVTESGGQRRLTLPKGLLKDREWLDVKVVILEPQGGEEIRIRRFIDAESLKNEGSRNKPGSA